MWMEPTQGRWVCPRCFDSNEADADRCPNCGLERGADPTAAPATTTPATTAGSPAGSSAGEVPQPASAAPGGPAAPWTAAPATQPARPGWLQLVQRFWWVGLLVIGGGIAAANYLGGSRSVTDIVVGDCFDLADPQANVIDDVTKQECTEPHQFEMYFIGDMPDGPFPSDDEVTVWIQSNCVPAFDQYVGIAFENSTLGALPITPTSDGWDSGDHSVQCALLDPNNAELTESLQGAAR